MSGSMMGIACRQEGHRFRGVIMAVAVNDQLEEAGDPEVLWEGRLCTSVRAAHREAMRRYWGFYEMRHGFKHPDDPSRTEADPPPSMDVVAFGSYYDN